MNVLKLKQCRNKKKLSNWEWFQKDKVSAQDQSNTQGLKLTEEIATTSTNG